MSYSKTVWRNDAQPPINASNLNKIEQGIYDAQESIAPIAQDFPLYKSNTDALIQDVDELQSDVSTAQSNISTLQSDVSTVQAQALQTDEALNTLVNSINTFYQATGSGTNISLANGTITQVPLITTGAITNGSDIFSISSGGIKVAESGNYKISASVFIGTTNDVWAQGCYIKTGTSFSSSAEIVSANLSKPIDASPQVGIVSGSKIVTLSADDIVFLCARVQGGTGTLYTGHVSTYLLVEKVSE